MFGGFSVEIRVTDGIISHLVRPRRRPLVCFQGGRVTPILVRPVREQLEHDRVIRLLQARWRRKYTGHGQPGDRADGLGDQWGQHPAIPTSCWRRSARPQARNHRRGGNGRVGEQPRGDGGVGADGPGEGRASTCTSRPARWIRPGGCAPSTTSRWPRFRRTTRSATRCGSRPCTRRPQQPRVTARRRRTARPPAQAEANVGQRGRADGKRAAQGREDRRSRAAARRRQRRRRSRSRSENTSSSG